MLYAIIGKDHLNSLQQRKLLRPEHLRRIENLQQQGRLIIAGPFPAIDNDDPGDAGFVGSLIVAEFNSQEEATKWANDDPYVKNTIFESITVKPFKQVLP